MKNISLITLLLIASFSLLQMDCKKEEQIIPPEDKPSVHPTIVWSADTIQNPYNGSQLFLTSIWGADTNDMYAVGHNERGGRAAMYHFDGLKWNSVVLTVGEGGFINSYISLIKIEGSGKNDIWAIGFRGSYYGSLIDSSLVLHYNGATWKEKEVPRGKYGYQGIKVISPNNVYFGGTNGQIIHYNGTGYEKAILDSTLDIISIGGDENNILVGGMRINKNYSVFSKQNNGSWQLIKTASEIEYAQSNSFGNYDFYPLGNGNAFVGGIGIYLLSGNSWKRIYDDQSYPFYSIKGTSPANIFAMSSFNRVVHWNGVDWKPILMPEGLSDRRSLQALWVDSKYVYLSYYYKYDQTIIFKGRYH